MKEINYIEALGLDLQVYGFALTICALDAKPMICIINPQTEVLPNHWHKKTENCNFMIQI